MKMTNLIDYHIPEAIQICVTKTDPEAAEALIELNDDATSNNKVCTFCVDPQLTSFDILQSLVVRAFNLQCDFALYYLDRSTRKSNLISKDADLHTAFVTSSHPYLDISLNVIDYGSALASLTSQVAAVGSEWQLSKNINKYRNILSEWDVVTNSDIILAQTINKTNNFIFKQLEKIKEKAISTTNNSWYLAETIYQYIIADDKRLDPIDDVAFRSFQDSEGRILSQRDLRIAVYRRGVEQSLRRVIWKHLLNVYPENYTGQERIDFIKLRCETYRQMRDLWQAQVKVDPEVIQLCNMVRKDVYRTDRHHPFYANRKSSPDSEEDDNPNVTALFNILITYALNHQYRYCQGMSDLASPLLYVMKDEAQAYVTFCALMGRLGENFSLDGRAISRKFDHLTALLKHYDSEFYRYLFDNGAHELLFCYRWMLLDLKREFPFEDTLEMLEVLWASIPPTTSAYQNLFDDGFLYIPNRTKMDEPKTVENNQQPTAVEKPVEKPKATCAPANTTSTTKTASKPLNQRIRSIKFLPNVLSTDSQVLDSPTTSDSDEADFAESLNRSCVQTQQCNGPAPWDSPDLSKQRRKFNFEHPSLGTSKCDTFGSISSDCYEATLLNEPFLDYHQEEDEAVFAEFDKANQNGSSNKSQGDDVSSCSTFDSGIQRSNTLSSMVQASDESVQSINMSRGDASETESAKSAGEEGAAAKRRQRFHCLNGLRNAHCNGDDLSEDEDGGDHHQFEDSIDIDPGYLTEFDCKTSALTASTHSTATMMSNHGEDRPRRSKPSMKLTMASSSLLSVGKSFSMDSLNNDTTKQQVDTASTATTTVTAPMLIEPQISVDAESPISEFEVNCAQSFPKLAKSVSEEILNNLESSINENMQTLSVGNNHDELDNLSSSSTSSLVILSKSTRSVEQKKSEQMDLAAPLLPPDKLGPNDAFMLFTCLTMMLQNRDRIIESQMDRNDIQMFFDNMIRKHNVRNVLNDARHLFHTYLSQWHKECLHK